MHTMRWKGRSEAEESKNQYSDSGEQGLVSVPCMVAASMVLHQFAWEISFWSLSQQMNTVPDDDLKLSDLSLLVPCADNSPAQ
jgi:hypothetical protein